MSREELYGLATDMDRLLGAGATTAVASDKLRDRGKIVTELAKKVPTLQPVAQAIDKVRNSSGKATATALLDLLVMTQQLRRSLTTSGEAGSIEGNYPPSEWKTPLGMKAFRNLHEALTHSKEDRYERVENAIKEKQVLDLRLLPLMIDEIEKSNTPLEGMLCDSGLALFGTSLLPELEAKINLKTGKVIDSRYLRVICGINPVRGREMCLAVLEEGTPVLRIAALHQLPKVGKPGEAEEWGMKMAKAKQSDLRHAALTSLCDAESEAAYEVLADALPSEDYMERYAASESLQTIKYPQATKKLLERLEKAIADAATLDAAVATAKKEKKAKAKTPAKGKAKQSKTDPVAEAESKLSNHYEFLERLIEVISCRKDERKAASEAFMAMTEWKKYPNQDELMQCIGRVGCQNPKVRPYLESMLKDTKFPKVSTALDAFEYMPPDERAPSMSKILAVAERPKVPDWIIGGVYRSMDGLFASNKKLLTKKFREVLAQPKMNRGQDEVLDIIRDLDVEDGKTFLADVLDFIIRGSDFYYDSEEILIKLDPEGKKAIPKLIEALGSKSASSRMMAADCLGKYGKLAAAAIPELEKRQKDKDWSVRYHIEAALQEIR
jgi:HEAT repeat protein